MENASKALLIAGAVLIVIVLISIGVMIVNSSSEMTEQIGETTSNHAVTAFNSTFNSYQGIQKGSSIKRLLQSISTNNATASNSSGHIITVTIISATSSEALSATNNSTTITQAAAKIVKSGRYEVVMSNVDSLGYINEITITRK